MQKSVYRCDELFCNAKTINCLFIADDVCFRHVVFLPLR